MPVLQVDSGSPLEARNVTSGITTPIQVLVVGSEYWVGSQSYIWQVLVGLNIYTPIGQIVTADNTPASTWARMWAQQAGVPWYNASSTFQGDGYNLYTSPLKILPQVTNILSFGVHCRNNAIIATGTFLGKTILQG
jgi:hypothetical protein